jgi:hypothetical protein
MIEYLPTCLRPFVFYCVFIAFRKEFKKKVLKPLEPKCILCYDVYSVF